MRIRFDQTLLCILSCGAIAGSQPPSRPQFVRAPIIYQNPNLSVPLAAIIEFSTDRPARTKLLLDDGRGERVLTVRRSYATDARIPVLGLRPGRKHLISVVVSDRFGNETKSPPLEFVTDPLPRDFPEVTATVRQPAQMEPGFTLFDPIKPNNASLGLLVAVDDEGEVVWYFRANESISDARRLENGDLLFLGVKEATQIDMLGNIIQKWQPSGRGSTLARSSIPVEADNFHHEIYRSSSNTFLVLSTELRQLAGYPASEVDQDALAASANVVGDVITEFTGEGTIIHQWHLLDILDPYRIGFGSLGSTWNSEYPEAIGGTADWTHANAVIEDPADHGLIVSLRHQDALIKIDRNSGNLIWILGTPDGWNLPWNRYLLNPIGALEWQYHQHAPEITPHGTLLVFDNGNFRHRPFDQRQDQNYSRAVEYSIDRDGMTALQVWSYGDSGDEIFFSNALGDVDWLPRTGNVLITDGSRVTPNVPASRWARIVEVTHTTPAQKVFELIVQDAPDSDFSGWRVYRSERLPNLYPPESGTADSPDANRPRANASLPN